MSVETITSPESLDALIERSRFVIVDFWAEWCGPCKAIGPLFAKLAVANSTPGGLAFARVNVDEQPEIAQRYAVRAMPTFVFAEGAAGGGAHAHAQAEAEAEKEKKGVELPSSVAGNSVQREGGRVVAIVGADARNLVAAANELEKIVKEEEAAAAAA